MDNQHMNENARYIKFVEWSHADQCFVGQCPGNIGPCCRGDDEAKVDSELSGIVEEWISTMIHDGKPLPPATAGRNIAEMISV